MLLRVTVLPTVASVYVSPPEKVYSDPPIKVPLTFFSEKSEIRIRPDPDVMLRDWDPAETIIFPVAWFDVR